MAWASHELDSESTDKERVRDQVTKAAAKNEGGGGGSPTHIERFNPVRSLFDSHRASTLL